MKEKSKLNVVLTIFGIDFALSPICGNNINFNAGDSNRGSEYGDYVNLDNEILKVSRVSGKIHLSYSYSVAKAAKICTDSGTYSNPNSIEDLVLNRGGAFLWAQKAYLKVPLLH